MNVCQLAKAIELSSIEEIEQSRLDSDSEHLDKVPVIAALRELDELDELDDLRLTYASFGRTSRAHYRAISNGNEFGRVISALDGVSIPGTIPSLKDENIRTYNFRTEEYNMFVSLTVETNPQSL